MKKVKFIPLGLVLPLISNLCMGQTRKCDLEVTIASPVKDAVIAYGETFIFTAVFKNNGPDDLVAGDTILYAGPQTPSGQASAFLLQQDLASGASLEGNLFEATNSNTKTEDVRSDGELCVEVFNPIDVLNNGSSWEDPELGNNRRCASFTIKGKPASNSIAQYGPSNVPLNCYPNPATDKINISLATIKDPVSIRLIDIAGREVVRKEIDELSRIEDNSVTLDVSRVGAGTYLLELRSETERAATKMVLQK